jgi:hypothetical protein
VLSKDSSGRKRDRSPDSKYRAATITRWRAPLLEAIKLAADQSDMPVAAFIRFAVKKELRRIGVSIGGAR